MLKCNEQKLKDQLKGQVMLFYKKRKMVVWVALFCLTALSCAKKDAPIGPDAEDQHPLVEKDGVITLRFYEITFDDGVAVETLVDSLDIVETKHCITIDNAIPFTFPVLSGTSFFFSGRFIGMPEPACVFLWFTYVGEDGTEGVGAYFLCDMLISSVVPSPQSPYLGEMNGYIVAFDTDNNNSGVGAVEIWNDTTSTIIHISPELNTAVLPPDLPVTKVELRDTNSHLRITCESSLSFINHLDGAVVVVEYNRIRDKGHTIRAVSTQGGREIYFFGNTSNEFTIWAFIPVFNKNGG